VPYHLEQTMFFSWKYLTQLFDVSQQNNAAIDYHLCELTFIDYMRATIVYD